MRKTVQKLNPREPSKEERSTGRRTCRFATGAGTASEGALIITFLIQK